MTAEDLKELKVIDKIIKEPEGGAQNNFEDVVDSLKKYLVKELKGLSKKSTEKLLEERYEKFRKIY